MTISTTVDGAFLDVRVTDALTVQDIPGLIATIDRARRNGPFVLLTDTLGMKNAPREAISVFADRLKALPPMKDVWLGDAIVINSSVVRFIVSTLIMIAPLPTEVRVFERRSDAMAWCASLLEAARLTVPNALRKSA